MHSLEPTYNKSVFFPLRNPQVRGKEFGTLDVSYEKPTILNPYEETHPENHLFFAGPWEYGLTKEGLDTIEYCDLNRPKLVKRRNVRLNNILGMFGFCLLLKGTDKESEAISKFKYFIKKYLDEGEYTLMIRWNFRNYLPQEYELK